MTTSWLRVKEIVADALEVEPLARPALVRRACAGDTRLHAEVVAMLDAAARADDFLEEPVALPASVRPLAPGTSLPPYTVVQQIGEGGFSEVYLAQQTRPIEREVALKLLKPGMDSRAVLTRFAAERQVLARMDHPHIARVLDAGASGDGRPFVVMELVRGEPLPRYVQDRALPERDRLALFLQVCDAVEHAHRRGIIHRDLKPSNVLVEEHDGSPRTKVIDFGIAKLLDGDDAAGAHTATGAVLGTPAYASPEQLRSGDVDTRADVYALGALLHEVLTGERLRAVEVVDARERTGGRTRCTFPHREIGWIVATATAGDRERRYGSVAALAADVRRHLAGEAIEAGPPTWRYRAGKFVGRHRLLLAASVLVALALAAGGVAAGVGFLRARQARDVAAAAASEAAQARARAELLAAEEAGARRAAEEALREAEAVGDFLVRLLVSARPDQHGRDVRVLDLLRAADGMFARVAAFPAAAVRLRRVVGETHAALGDYAAADRHLREALALCEQHGDLDAWQRVEALFALASLRCTEGRLDEGEVLLAEVTRAAEAARGAAHPLARRLHDLHAKTAFERGRNADAVTALRALLALDEADGRTDAVAATLGNLAQALLNTGARDEAERLARRGRDMARAAHGDRHPLTIAAGRKLAAVHVRDHDHAALIAAVEPLLADARACLGATHPDTLGLENYLAFGYQQAGRLDEAEVIYRRLLVAHEQRLGPQHPQVLMVASNLGKLLEARGDLAGAEACFADAAARFRTLRGPSHLDTHWADYHHARIVAARGRHTEAAATLARAVAGLRAHLGDGHPSMGSVLETFTAHLRALAQTRPTR